MSGVYFVFDNLHRYDYNNTEMQEKYRSDLPQKVFSWKTKLSNR